MKSLDGLKSAVPTNIESFESEHPVVRTHPSTGRKSLYVSRSHTLRFKNMTEAESAPLNNYLSDFATRPEITCRLRWEPKTLAILGQSLHQSLRDQRLCGQTPADASCHYRRRPPDLEPFTVLRKH